ncbi:MAG: hypothetical protein IT462_11930 [Planctomycetes bacterium]|nr:hypothetical protein [Planctomycetota bacterium]
MREEVIGDARLSFRVGHISEAAELVVRWHYSKRAPANPQFVGTWHEAGGLFGDYGPAVAACFLCIPPTRWGEDLLELGRLVRSPAVNTPLTGLISATCRRAGRNGADLIVSYADQTQRHHGGIYQAASWNYAGCREQVMDGLIVNGQFVPGRSCNSTWGTRSPAKLRTLFPDWGIEPHYDQGKHLYWKAINRAGERKAARLGLQKIHYPKPRLFAEPPKQAVQDAMV